MLGTSILAATRTARRIVPSLGLAAAVLTSTLGAATPADAFNPPRGVVQVPAQAYGGTTAARIQINLISMNIVNDRDGTFMGDGEMKMTVSFWRCSTTSGPCSQGEIPAVLMAEWKKNFSAGSGDFKVFERVMPQAGDSRSGDLATPEAGFALHAGQRYIFQIDMDEDDLTSDDFMGGIQQVFEESNQWGLGLHAQERAGKLLDSSIATGPICAGCGGVIVGDYLVTYEVVQVPLPDLQPTSIRVVPRAPGATDDEVCVDTFNSGLTDSPSFSIALYVDDSPLAVGLAGGPALAAHTGKETCLRANLPTSGQHQLKAVVDEPALIAEMDEYDNLLQKPLDRGPAAVPGAGTGPSSTAKEGPIATASPEPTTKSNQAQSDLTVSAIKVNGQAPDGKDDCTGGKSNVSVVVKNAGKARAEAFVVSLVADGGDAIEEAVNGLEAGKEREVKFEDVELKKGAHKLVASVDAKGTVTEPNEENNGREVTAQCKDAR
jgi:hypothetical protein